jgi:hypothetical protein
MQPVRWIARKGSVSTNEPQVLRSGLFAVFLSDHLFDRRLECIFSMRLPLSLPVPHTHAIASACSCAGACPDRCEFRGRCHLSSGCRGRYPSPRRIPHRHHSICKLQRDDEHLHGAHHRILHFRGEPQLHGGRCGHGNHQGHGCVHNHGRSIGRGGRGWDLYREHPRGSHRDNSRDTRRRQLPEHNDGHHQCQRLLQLHRAADSVIELTRRLKSRRMPTIHPHVQ